MARSPRRFSWPKTSGSGHPKQGAICRTVAAQVGFGADAGAMFYVLMVIPHLVAIAGLLAYALRSAPVEAGEDGYGDFPGPEGGPEAPVDPSSGPPVDYPVLTDGATPHRRMHVGERLSDLHPRRARREHPAHAPSPPQRAGNR